jgi:hypothetical protein
MTDNKVIEVLIRLRGNLRQAKRSSGFLLAISNISIHAAERIKNV